MTELMTCFYPTGSTNYLSLIDSTEFSNSSIMGQILNWRHSVFIQKLVNTQMNFSYNLVNEIFRCKTYWRSRKEARWVFLKFLFLNYSFLWGKFLIPMKTTLIPFKNVTIGKVVPTASQHVYCTLEGTCEMLE